jgi:hypothetical protein
MRDGMQVQLCGGREDLEVVGDASYQDNLWRIVGGRNTPNDPMRREVYAVLVAEPDNPYDANAVSVERRAGAVGRNGASPSTEPTALDRTLLTIFRSEQRPTGRS